MKFDATCKMVRSDWPRILDGSPGQSPAGEMAAVYAVRRRRGSPFVQWVRQFGDGGVWFRV